MDYFCFAVIKCGKISNDQKCSCSAKYNDFLQCFKVCLNMQCKEILCINTDLASI